MARPKKRQLNPGHHVPTEFVGDEMPLNEDEFEAELAAEHDTALPLVETAPIDSGMVLVKILRETWDSNENRLAVGSIVSVSKADFDAMDAKGFVERV